MKHILLIIGLMSTFTVVAGENAPFSCIDKATLTISADCMATRIESSTLYRHQQEALLKKAIRDSNEAVISTITFYQNKMEIEVVAHRHDLKFN